MYFERTVGGLVVSFSLNLSPLKTTLSGKVVFGYFDWEFCGCRWNALACRPYTQCIDTNLLSPKGGKCH